MGLAEWHSADMKKNYKSVKSDEYINFRFLRKINFIFCQYKIIIITLALATPTFPKIFFVTSYLLLVLCQLFWIIFLFFIKIVIWGKKYSFLWGTRKDLVSVLCAHVAGSIRSVQNYCHTSSMKSGPSPLVGSPLLETPTIFISGTQSSSGTTRRRSL